jgi:F-type H+-transporting ATPase subunit gamma
MASLKEVKGRISSVKSIWKITSAMRMIASAKLHRAQGAVENLLPYERQLHRMLSSLLSAGDMGASPYAHTREVKRVAIVAFSSNSSLAGGFNSNVIKMFQATVAEQYPGFAGEDILVFPVGRKIYDAVVKLGYTPQGDFQKMADTPDYRDAGELAKRLTEMFRRREVDRVDLVYNHFKSMAVQIPTREIYLPVPPHQAEVLETESKFKVTPDFILEPSHEELVETMLPKVLEMKIYATLLDSAAAEHAARTVAMQLATDNADELLEELTLQYNKSRQQAITNELLDIISGAAAK